MRLYPLILLFLLVYIETTLFIAVANRIGTLFSLLLLIATSFIGFSLVRSQGLKTLIQIQQKLANGENPAGEMIKSVSLLFAGFLLIIPGFFTDFLGLLLMLTPIQKLLTLKLMPFVKIYQPMTPHNHQTPPSQQSGNVIDGEFKRKD